MRRYAVESLDKLKDTNWVIGSRELKNDRVNNGKRKKKVKTYKQWPLKRYIEN